MRIHADPLEALQTTLLARFVDDLCGHLRAHHAALVAGRAKLPALPLMRCAIGAHAASASCWTATKSWGSKRTKCPVRTTSSRWSQRRSTGVTGQASSSHSETIGV